MGATMIIGGERRAAASGAVDEITSPWDGRVVGTVPRAAPADAPGGGGDDGGEDRRPARPSVVTRLRRNVR